MPTSKEGGLRVEALLTEEQIQARIREMGAQITRDYQGKDLALVAVLKGSYVFLADLARAIDLPLTVDFMGISSYVGTKSTGVVRVTSDLNRPIEGQDVLLVEDIIDTGLTMKYLLENLGTRRPASLKLAAFLEKPSRAKVKIPIDYRGFEVEDHFLVGYGLDVDGKLRNLPYVGVLRGGM
ncbi:MAG TPA: hypoxanthine phosphoribosyltransferase [Anaeromyxobacteraceae bacterium]|nr:hypoxanthine phosphoribosyltransferase [Anaeromyxobacteraceae bacterium]